MLGVLCAGWHVSKWRVDQVPGQRERCAWLVTLHCIPPRLFCKDALQVQQFQYVPE